MDAIGTDAHAEPRKNGPVGRPPPKFGDVILLSESELSRYTIGFLNLLCATGLPGSDGLNIDACLSTLEEWTQVVDRETKRLMPRFIARPGEYENSEGYFRTLVMVTVLQRDLGVTYDPSCMTATKWNHSGEGFLHGLLGARKTGTCANMPVLYAAIGRRLGYPIYLVQACGHLFCRWQTPDNRERFNIEGSGRGLNVYPDDYYMEWPNRIDAADVRNGVFLRNLTPAQEVAQFLGVRGHVLRDHGRIVDALVAYAHAHRLDPISPHHMGWLMTAINEEIRARATGKLPGTYRAADKPELFSIAGVLPVSQYVLHDRFTRATDFRRPVAPGDGKMESN